ncbi:hypothetical protein VMCG_04377 [Cytospora schulzeri]|uniref:Uncharacterized protein n=1 Tax=Cytospora schulzeri TaxID=448051 RepID=A0A423WTJ9_9PEZI|nr:hypothetical protein VMCG_04377 [Valsa malicola]
MSSSQSPFPHRNNNNNNNNNNTTTTGGRLSSNSSASSSSHRGGPFHGHAHWDTPAELDQPFTTEMRDRQARGKDPYSAGDDISDASDPKEPFSKVERRDWAETVLDNPELLMMYAQSSGDTLPATRYKFKKIMCGFEDDDEDDESLPDTRGGGNYQQQQYQTQQQQRGRGGGGGGGGGESRR